MTEIDQISQILGRLESDMESSQRQRADLFAKVSEVKDIVGNIRSELALLQATDTEQAKKIDKLATDVASLKISRVKAATALAVVAGMGAGVYEGLGKIAGMALKVVGNN